MATRGVLYVVWGATPGSNVAQGLERSRRSLAEYHAELPVVVRELPPGSSLLDKSQLFDLSPFDQTLYLDADTVVLDDLSYGFEQGATHGLACAICEAPYARRHAKAVCGDVVEYNSGVLFFDRRESVRRVMDRWRALSRTLDTSLPYRTTGGFGVCDGNDQASLAAAVHEERFNPFVLPLNWNFRPQWHKSGFGPLKIWHDAREVPEAVYTFNAQQKTADNVLDFFFVG